MKNPNHEKLKYTDPLNFLIERELLSQQSMLVVANVP